MKIRLLFIVNTVDYGGTEKHLFELVRRLDACRVDCTILCYGIDFYTKRLLDRPDVRVVTPNQVTPRTLFTYWFTFLKFRPHVIVFVKGSVDSYPLQGYLAARLSGSKRLIAIEQLIAYPLPPKLAGRGLWNCLRRLAGWRTRFILTYIWKIRLAGSLIDKTICVSTAVRDRLINVYGYPPHKTVTIPNGVDIKHFGCISRTRRKSIRTSLGLAPHDTTFVCVARLVPRKRVDILLDAFAIVSRKHSSGKCLIAGSGPIENELRARCLDLGLSSSVTFLGFAEDIRPYLEAADVYVSASEREGLPLALPEAMTYGLPAVVTDISGHNDVVLHGDTGLLITPGSVHALSEALEYLLVHKEERHRMGIRARKRVVESFSMDDGMKEIQHVLLDNL